MMRLQREGYKFEVLQGCYVKPLFAVVKENPTH
jgi:hypothetical protein